MILLRNFQCLRQLRQLSKLYSPTTISSRLMNNGKSSSILVTIDDQFNIKYFSTNNNQSMPPKQKEANAKFVEDGTRMPIKERLKHMVVLYGPLATVLHISLSLGFLGITYVVVKYGFDALGFLQNSDFLSESYMRILSTGGTFGLAYALYKAMMPFRVLVTIFVTPKVANKLQSMGLIKKRF